MGVRTPLRAQARRQGNQVIVVHPDQIVGRAAAALSSRANSAFTAR